MATYCDFCGRRGHGKTLKHRVESAWFTWGIFELHANLHYACRPKLQAWGSRHDWRGPAPHYPLRRRGKGHPG